jgi:NADH-quinone oxidoreductase subunit M
MLGYSSVMHMGYIFLGIASANLIGLNGAAVLMFAHGISIALLFALAGEIRRRTGTSFSAISAGSANDAVRRLCVSDRGFAAIGLPGFANFAAEVMVFFGAFRVGADWQGFHLFQVATASRSGAWSFPRFTCCVLIARFSWGRLTKALRQRPH